MASILIRCIECGTLVKCDGETTAAHTELHHKHSRGETAALCIRCWDQWAVRSYYLAGSWRAGERKKPKE